MLIDGEWVGSANGGEREILNPADSTTVATVPEGTRDDVRRAIVAARRAFDEGPWPHTTVQERSRILNRVADLLERDESELARLETLDTGKTLAESHADMQDIAGTFRYYASLIATHGGGINPVPAQSLSMTVHEPVGVAGMISPWNYPLLQISWKMAPAIAAGCTFVAKPSELTPLTTIKIGELLQEAGLPDGVANVVLGAGAEVGAELSESPDVDFVSFTGGVASGRKVAESATESIKRVALELGGKNPNIVFADADFETAVDYALQAAFFHAGQVCSAGARLLVEESIHDEFVDALLVRASRIKLGTGTEPETEMGPLISAEHREKVEGYIEIAKEEGAELRLGGRRPQDERFESGFFLEPTVFTGVRPEMRVAKEEIFGPVLTVESFASEEEAVRNANATEYGLAGAVWTTDMGRAHRVSRTLRLGTVWVNDFHPYYPQAPWGGYKQSGTGRELGVEGLHEYLETKHISVNLAPEPSNWFGAGN
jgi:betaine-aldehyde dehydrogenase